MTSLPLTKRKSKSHATSPALSDLRQGEGGVLDRIELAEEDARRIMEMGFIPGTRIEAGRSAPGGDPRVYRVDGSEVALRRETASRLKLRRASAAAD
jgi:Fe2+ transport system protein FeoA